MVELASIAAALTGMKTATDIAKGLVDIKSKSDVQSAVIELQSTILSAQSSAMAAQSDQYELIEKVRALEKEVSLQKAWTSEKAKYKLTELEQGFFVYALQEAEYDNMTPHHLCTSCFEKEEKSILQGPTTGYGYRILKCPICKNEVRHSNGGDYPRRPASTGYF